MKNGKTPTLKQKKRIKSLGLIADNWLVSKDCADYFVIVHRVSGEVRALKLKEVSKC